MRGAMVSKVKVWGAFCSASFTVCLKGTTGISPAMNSGRFII